MERDWKICIRDSKLERMASVRHILRRINNTEGELAEVLERAAHCLWNYYGFTINILLLRGNNKLDFFPSSWRLGLGELYMAGTVFEPIFSLCSKAFNASRDNVLP